MKRKSIRFIVQSSWFVAFLVITIHLSFVTPILALEPTKTASPSSDLKLKLKALQEEIASRATQLKAEVSKKLQNKAYIGFVKSKSDNALTLATSKDTKIVTLNEYTQYANQIKTTSSRIKVSKEPAANDYVVTLGDVDENGVLTAKKVIKITPPTKDERLTIFGDVTSLGDETISLQTKQNQNITVTVSDDTIFHFPSGQAASFMDIKTDRTIIVGGKSPKNGVIEADFIYILSSGNIKPKPATSSSPSASGSAKLTPSPTKKPTPTPKR